MAGFEIPAHAVDALEREIWSFYGQVGQVKDSFQQELLQAIKVKAQAMPQWAGITDWIDTWDENDRMWFGVRGSEFESEAFAAEYGTEEQAPGGLLRTLDERVLAASVRASDSVFGRNARLM